MKKFGKKLFLSLISLLLLDLNNLSAQRILEKTMYACCSPYELCDMRLFSSKRTCMQICGGHNRCKAKTAHVMPHPFYGVPVAHIAPHASAFITGITHEATPLAVSGPEVLATQEVSVAAPE